MEFAPFLKKIAEKSKESDERKKRVDQVRKKFWNDKGVETDDEGQIKSDEQKKRDMVRRAQEALKKRKMNK